MNRRFGIELEITGITQAKAVAALRAVGLEVSTPGYTHSTASTWKIVPDGSVHNGFEVVSPILQGEAGLDVASVAINALKTASAKADRTCGFHVHFDASGLGVEELRTIVNRYAAFETQIDAFMPPSRRASANTYCKPVRSFINNSSFQEARNVSELARAQGGRYYKVNLQSLHRHGTIEFRQHNGIVDADRALNWIRMLDAFIAESIRIARTEPAQAGAAPAISPERNLTPSQRRLVEMLRTGSNNAATLATLLRVQPHTLRAAITRIRQAGVTIRSSRRNGTTFYELAANDASAPAQLRQDIIGADTLWAGIDAAIATFYRNRAAVLALAA